MGRDFFHISLTRSSYLSGVSHLWDVLRPVRQSATSNAHVVYIIEVLSSRKQYETGAARTSKGPLQLLSSSFQPLVEHLSQWRGLKSPLALSTVAHNFFCPKIPANSFWR